MTSIAAVPELESGSEFETILPASKEKKKGVKGVKSASKRKESKGNIKGDKQRRGRRGSIDNEEDTPKESTGQGHLKSERKSKVQIFEETPSESVTNIVDEPRRSSTTFDLGVAQDLSDQIMKAFRPFEIFMKILLRFPLVHERVPEEGCYRFKFVPKSAQNIGFLVTGFLLVLILLLTFANLIGTLLNSPKQDPHKDMKSLNVTFPADEVRVHELYLFVRNIAPVIMITTSLAHASVGTINFFLKRHFAASCLTFWTQAAGLLKINLADGVRKYFAWILGSYGGIILVIIGLNIAQFIPMATGTPAILAVLLGRAFDPYIFALSTFWIFRSFCSIIFFYIIICSKVYILLFLFQCKLLKNAFAVWNERLESVLHGDEAEKTKEERNANRTGFTHLFKDHVCLLDMIDGSDKLFAHTIETYFGTQLVSICFEIYYLYRSQAAKDEFMGARRLDGVYMLIYLAQTVLILYVVSKSAADVGSTAMDGLEIIRRKGMMGRKSDEELYFMLSMYISFNGHLDTALGGGKYFVLDNAFLVGITGTIFSYFIILIQFTPRLSYMATNRNETAYLSRELVNELLRNFEGTRQVFNNLLVDIPPTTMTTTMTTVASNFTNTTMNSISTTI